jgi:hypothetical protein
MNILLSHAAEVVGEAVDILAGSGSLRDRMLLAGRILIGVTPDDFKRFPELQTAYDDIMRVLTTVQDATYGSVEATVEKISGVARKRVAAQILELDRAIRATP